MKCKEMKSDEFLQIIQSTKNLSDKTLLAYRSELKDFQEFLQDNEFDEMVILKYVQIIIEISYKHPFYLYNLEKTKSNTFFENFSKKFLQRKPARKSTG